jgi:hypothetical protein
MRVGRNPGAGAERVRIGVVKEGDDEREEGERCVSGIGGRCCWFIMYLWCLSTS